MVKEENTSLNTLWNVEEKKEEIQKRSSESKEQKGKNEGGATRLWNGAVIQILLQLLYFFFVRVGALCVMF